MLSYAQLRSAKHSGPAPKTAALQPELRRKGKTCPCRHRIPGARATKDGKLPRQLHTTHTIHPQLSPLHADFSTVGSRPDPNSLSTACKFRFCVPQQFWAQEPRTLKTMLPILSLLCFYIWLKIILVLQYFFLFALISISIYNMSPILVCKSSLC